MINRFFNVTVPIHKCNLECSYCFVTQTIGFKKEKEEFPRKTDEVIRALSKERTGGISLINFCGLGETLFQKEIIEISKGLLQNGQYISIVTNNTLTNRIEMLCDFSEDIKKNLFIKCSFQYEQLVKKNLLDIFFQNIELLRNNNISYTIEMVANDSIISQIENIKEIFNKKKEALPHILEARDTSNENIKRLTNLEVKKHQEIWKTFNSPLFKAQQSVWEEKRKEFCYAGEYSADIDLASGNMYQCNKGKMIQNIYKNIDKPLQFCAIGTNCNMPHCFISYVWQGLCGNINKIDYPTYYEMRDRERPDKTHWVNNSIKLIFDNKISQNMQSYSEQKEKIVNSIMKIYYDNNIMDNDLAVIEHRLNEICEDNLVSSFAIYGKGRIGMIFKKILEKNYTFKCYIDRNEDLNEKTYSYETYKNKGIKSDIIFITPFVDSVEIKKYLKNNERKTCLVNIWNVIDVL